MNNDFEGRTKQKLEFAALSLKEITSRSQLGSIDDFERSHEENFLYHLVGAKDSFLQEINKAYKLDVPIEKVRERTLAEKSKQMEIECPELSEIIDLKDRQKAGWLALAIELRNIGSHRFHMSRVLDLHVGGEEVDKVFFRNPFTGKKMDEEGIEFLTRCLDNMRALLERLRATLPKS